MQFGVRGAIAALLSMDRPATDAPSRPEAIRRLLDFALKGKK
jgi:hypothetical protein